MRRALGSLSELSDAAYLLLVLSSAFVLGVSALVFFGDVL